MKKILALIVISMTLSGCVIYGPNYQLSSFDIDLSKFKDQGIFVTTGDYNQSPYTSVAIIVCDCYPGYQKKSGVKSKVISDDVYSNPDMQRKKDYLYMECSYDDLIVEMIKIAKEKNANGIIQLKINNLRKPSADGKSFIEGVQIEGLAIRVN